MNQYLEVFRQSPNFSSVVAGKGNDIRLLPVYPDEFKMTQDKLVIQRSAIDAIAYVQDATERLEQEHSLVLYGEHRDGAIELRDYSIAVGDVTSVCFRPEQMKMAKKTYKQENGEVVFAHTHVAKGTNYNFFSVSDLLFLIKQAARNKRDVYGMLISKDGAIPIKYSYVRNEFFRVHVVIDN